MLTFIKIRFRRTVALARASWSVLRSDRSLAWFPVLSALVSMGIVLAMAALGWMTKGTTTNASGDTTYTANAATAVIAVIGYVGVAFAQTYFLAALVGAANEIFDGRPTSVRNGTKIASSRAGRLLPWAMVTATVSWILRSLEQRAGFVGDLILGIIGGAWSVLTFLTVPIIVFEDVGPITALKRSGTVVKATWGENVIAQIGFGLLMLPVVIVAGLIIALGVMTKVAAVAIVAVVVGVLTLIVASVVLAALNGVFRTALYRYAVTGETPSAFAGTHLDQAFRPKANGAHF